MNLSMFKDMLHFILEEDELDVDDTFDVQLGNGDPITAVGRKGDTIILFGSKETPNMSQLDDLETAEQTTHEV